MLFCTCRRDLYECSCSELEELTATARDAGAIGTRLTGTLLLAEQSVVNQVTFRDLVGRQHVSWCGMWCKGGLVTMPWCLPAGAGWGGCTVSLVLAGDEAAFIGESACCCAPPDAAVASFLQHVHTKCVSAALQIFI